MQSKTPPGGARNPDIHAGEGLRGILSTPQGTQPFVFILVFSYQSAADTA